MQRVYARELAIFFAGIAIWREDAGVNKRLERGLAGTGDFFCEGAGGLAKFFHFFSLRGGHQFAVMCRFVRRCRHGLRLSRCIFCELMDQFLSALGTHALDLAFLFPVVDDSFRFAHVRTGPTVMRLVVKPGIL